jgi:predicted RNase H-like HicB family nuclease
MSTKSGTPTIEELLARQYPVQIHHLQEEGAAGYYLAFLPDFGQSACSATGDDMAEAIANLADVKRGVLQHYLETGREIPEPSPGPLEPPVLQQMPLRLPKDIHDSMKQRASESGMSLNAYATKVLTEHLTMCTVETKLDAFFKEMTAKLVPATNSEWVTAPDIWRTEGIGHNSLECAPGFRSVWRTGHKLALSAANSDALLSVEGMVPPHGWGHSGKGPVPQ